MRQTAVSGRPSNRWLDPCPLLDAPPTVRSVARTLRSTEGPRCKRGALDGRMKMRPPLVRGRSLG